MGLGEGRGGKNADAAAAFPVTDQECANLYFSITK